MSEQRPKRRSSTRGQIIKRGESRYLIRVPLGRDAEGRRKYFNETCYGTKKDAQEKLAKLVAVQSTGALVQPTKQTLSEMLHHWLAHTAAKTVRRRTAERYDWLAQKYITPSLGHIRADKLTTEVIEAAYAKLETRGLSPRTIRLAHSVLHSALEQAVDRGHLPRNVSTKVKLPRERRREMRALSPSEVPRLMAASKGTRFEALWALLLDGGLRPGEALALQWADFSGNEVHIQRSLAHLRDGSAHFDAPKTRKSERRVPLHAQTISLLKAHRREQVARRLQSTTWQPLDLVFSNATGGPIEWRVIARRYWKPLVKAAGLGAARPYDLRHTCASLLLLAGVNPKVVAERLGHSTINQTLETYSHVLPTMQDTATTALGIVIYGEQPITALGV